MYGPGSKGLFKPKYDFMSISLIILGIGSFLFHASLRQNLQYVDDLSMLLAASAMLHGLFTVRATPAQRLRSSALLALIVGGFSVFYVWSGTIIYHTLAFATQILVLTFRCLYLFKWQEHKFPEDKVRSWNKRRWQASGIFFVGYILWHIDLELCMQLRAFRAEIWLPWAWLFELHGWWHILTAIGTNHFVKVVREIREEDEREKAVQNGKKGN
ncbi:hypothetical protein jhhlp_005804 [Lomentospora prolificans]|uniref:Ceramidase n=1 Tax=Lomentospora prolificans TaxID=41688 RepID=A0A2N3N447_9PEZI|nr:hypothetical protein jhhlp_005804 [Lomentospora prolificans]